MNTQTGRHTRCASHLSIRTRCSKKKKKKNQRLVRVKEGLFSTLLRLLDALLVTWWWSGGRGVGRRDLRGPGDNAERRVGVVHAREHGVRAADIPVVVVALDGHDGRVWKTTGGQSD